MAHAAALPIITVESGLTRYLEKIRRFPMLEPQEEYMLARAGARMSDRDAAIGSSPAICAWWPRSPWGIAAMAADLRGDLGRQCQAHAGGQALQGRTKAFGWPPMRCGGSRRRSRKYILRSWSLVKMGTTANQKKLFFNLRKAKSRISALEEGDLRPDQVKLLAERLGVTEQEVVDMNRRLGWRRAQRADPRRRRFRRMAGLAGGRQHQSGNPAGGKRKRQPPQGAGRALTVLNERERRIFEARRLADEPITLENWRTRFGVSRERVRQIQCGPSRRCKGGQDRIAALETSRSDHLHIPLPVKKRSFDLSFSMGDVSG